MLLNTAVETLVGSQYVFSQALMENGWQPAAFGQVRCSNNNAQIEWLLPLIKNFEKSLLEIIDNLCMEAGLHGAKFITASSPSDESLFELLRIGGFTTYDWHSFWKANPQKILTDINVWEKPADLDVSAVQGLRKRLLSPAVQSVNQLENQCLPHFVLRLDGKLLGYANLMVGSSALVVTPFLSPEILNPAEILSSLCTIFYTKEKPLFIQQTGGMAWLINHLENISDLFLERQELLVKHFTVMESAVMNEMNTAMNSRHVDPAVPFTTSTGRGDNL
jgi:hypothetical protein